MNFPISVDLKPYSYEVENQGAIGSCTANATVEACEFLRPSSYSRLFAYYNSRNDTNRLTTEGVDLVFALSSLQRYGVPLESEYPYDVALENVRPDQRFYNGTTPVYKVLKYDYIHAVDLKSLLNEGYPVVAAIVARNDLTVLSGPWQTHQLSKDNPILGLHAVLIIGYDDNAQRWLIQNSWGKEWGDGGYFGYPYDVARQDAYEFWVIRDFDGYTARPATNDSRALVYLNGGGDSLTVANSGVRIVAGNGKDYVKILPNVRDVTVDANIDQIELCNTRASFSIVQTDGVGFQVMSGGYPVFTINSVNDKCEIIFTDSSVTLTQIGICKYEIDGVPL
jgi:hypothetical protein